MELGQDRGKHPMLLTSRPVFFQGHQDVFKTLVGYRDILRESVLKIYPGFVFLRYDKTCRHGNDS